MINILQNKDAKFLITTQLSFLNACGLSPLYIPKLNEVKEIIFWDIVLLYSVSNQDELEQMDSSAIEFVSFSLDCVSNHKSDVPKTETLKLFETLADN